MIIRGFMGLMLALLVFCGSGCEKASSARRPAGSKESHVDPSYVEPIARLHWLGKNHISNDTNAAALMAIWNLPESKQLEAQTVEKLSTASWRLLLRQSGTNPASALLRPIIEDMVNEECYLEISQASGQTRDIVLAIRLPDSEASLWKTNLAAVLESLTGIHPVKANSAFGWSLKKHDVPNLLELSRVGDWTIVGLAQKTNVLRSEIQNRIERGKVPFLSKAETNWMEGFFDVAQMFASNSLSLEISNLNFSISGEAGNVRTRADLLFQTGEGFGELEPWKIPADLIDGSFGSFTAVRGIRPLLERSRFWNTARLGPAPNQAWIWALQGMLMQTYLAAPLARSNQIQQVTDTVMQRAETWFPNHDIAGFERSKAFEGVEWKGFPFMSPFLRSMEESGDEFLVAGFFPLVKPAQALPPELMQILTGQTNLLMYDWELTGSRIEQWIYMGQFCRVVLQKAQLPAGSASLKWLQALVPRLGNSATELVQTGPQQLSFSRKSTSGFTAIEMNLFADWLESPEFPKGLHTLLAPVTEP